MLCPVVPETFLNVSECIKNRYAMAVTLKNDKIVSHERRYNNSHFSIKIPVSIYLVNFQLQSYPLQFSKFRNKFTISNKRYEIEN